MCKSSKNRLCTSLPPIAVVLVAALWGLSLMCPHLAMSKANPKSPSAGEGTRHISNVANVPHYEIVVSSSWEPSPLGQSCALPVRTFVPGSEMWEPGTILLLADTGATGSKSHKVKDAEWPAWSPDGGRIAYSQTTQRVLWLNIRESRIALYSLTSGVCRTLLGGYVDRAPRWSRDGKLLAYVRLRCPERGFHLQGWVMVVPVRDGGFCTPHALGRRHTSVSVLEWKPSGSAIAYIANTAPPHKYDVYLVDARTGKNKRLTRTGDVVRYSLSWSPDGSRIAFSTRRTEPDFAFKTLEVIDVRTCKRRVVLKLSDLGGRKPLTVSSIAWSPKGDRILFDVSRYEPGILSDIGVVDWPGLKFRWLTHNEKSTAPRWSRDGRKVLYVRDGNEVWEADANGAHGRRLYAVNASDVSGVLPKPYKAK